MSNSAETMIILPKVLMKKIVIFTEINHISQEEAIIQLLNLALSRESRKPILKEILPPDFENDDSQ